MNRSTATRSPAKKMSNDIHLQGTLMASARELLIEAGVRVTQARLQVLQTLLPARTALSHQQLQELLPEMDRVTLYRALECLTDAALSHRITDDDRTSRYSTGLAGSNSSAIAHTESAAKKHAYHGHFKCIDCGDVFCLELGHGPSSMTGEARLRNILHNEVAAVLGAGFESHQIEFTVKGRCSRCAHAS